MKLLFIVGLQKSGTSLLNRLLMLQTCVSNPFLPEGKFFWGDDPPFTPTAQPCGALYQKYQGQRGHALCRENFNSDDQTLLQQRIKESAVQTTVLMNKNPYNTVRIDWLKKMFPECKIVAIFRKPPSNIFSLYKKYQTMDEATQADDGWWGVKPPNWKDLLNSDKIIQASKQWTVVNQFLLNQIDQVDQLLTYADLCKNPERQLSTILKLVGEQVTTLPETTLSCMDAEYKTGGLLESRNKTLRQTGQFDLTVSNQIEIPGLTESQINSISEITNPTYQRLLNRIN